VAPQLAVSPDGGSIVFVASTDKGAQLWHRSLGSVEANVLPGTEGAAFPFWSPDSRAVAFFAEGKLKRTRVDSGAPQVLCDAVAGRGGTWNRDNVIVFSPSIVSPLQRVSAGGGVPEVISELDAEYGESSHRFPEFLPDGRHFFYIASIGTCCPAEKPSRVKIGVLDSKATETLMNAESTIAYSNGHLLFVDRSSNALMAQPFAPVSRRLSGGSFPVVGGLASEGSRYASFSVSATGMLVHARGNLRPASRLTWYDRSGRATAGAEGQFILNLSLASDDKSAAATIVDPQTSNRDIWVIDTVTNAQTRVSFDATQDEAPIWFPDRRHLLFVGRRGGSWSIIKKAIGDAANEERLFTQEGTVGTLFVNDVSADGTILFHRSTIAALGQADLWVLRPGEAAPRPYITTSAVEQDAAFSPDGKWVAYQSNEVGLPRPQVYVEPYPATGGKFQISREVGRKPLWRSDGKELFFLSDGAVMSATIDTTKGFQAGSPQRVFSANLGLGPTSGRHYGVTRDGQRFLLSLRSQEALQQSLTVTTNWLSAVRQQTHP
jgi:eukaryotic-like serine/threonine-protein kinase